MFLIIALNSLKSAARFCQIFKTKKSLGFWQEAARPGVLNDCRFSTGQIIYCTLACPCGLKQSVAAFHAAELAARVMNIRLECSRCRAHLFYVADLPSMLLQDLAVFG